MRFINAQTISFSNTIVEHNQEISFKNKLIEELAKLNENVYEDVVQQSK